MKTGANKKGITFGFYFDNTIISLITAWSREHSPTTPTPLALQNMVDTRSSPSRANTRQSTKRRMPPLPTNAKKKTKKSLKPSSKQVAAAKKRAAAAEAMKNQPIEVKEEVMTGKRRMWTEEEDIAACKA